MTIRDIDEQQASTVEPPPAAPRIFGGILPYETEVAEPNGPRIAAWVLADYADRADAIFQKWLAEHDAAITQQAKAEALREAADEVDSLYFGPDQHTPFTRGAAYLWGAKQAAKHVRSRADAAGDDLTASEGENGPVEGESSHAALEALLCPECDHHIKTHNMNGCRFVRCACPRTPEDVARPLIEQAANIERTRLTAQLRLTTSSAQDSGDLAELDALADEWEAGTDG